MRIVNARYVTVSIRETAKVGAFSQCECPLILPPPEPVQARPSPPVPGRSPSRPLPRSPRPLPPVAPVRYPQPPRSVTPSHAPSVTPSRPVRHPQLACINDPSFVPVRLMSPAFLTVPHSPFRPHPPRSRRSVDLPAAGPSPAPRPRLRFVGLLLDGIRPVCGFRSWCERRSFAGRWCRWVSSRWPGVPYGASGGCAAVTRNIFRTFNRLHSQYRGRYGLYGGGGVCGGGDT